MGIVVAPLTLAGGGIVVAPLTTIADATPPVFTAGLSVSAVLSDGFTVGFTVNEAATVYGICVPQGSTPPSIAQIIAGVDYAGGDVLDAFSVSALAGIARTADFTGIVGHEGDPVVAYVTAVDTAGNQQSSSLSAITTLAGGVAPDIDPPVITLSGANPMQLIQGTPYSEPGYTAIDVVDGDVTGDVTVSGTVDHTTVNQYSLTYSVTDAAGNLGTRVRVVNVIAASQAAEYPFNRSIIWDDARTPELVIGDTFQHLVTLNSNGQPFDLSGASAIRAVVVSGDHAVAYTAALDMSSESLGADWSGGQVMIYMSGASTAGISEFVQAESLGKIEIEATLGVDKFTWFGVVRIVPGQIN